MATTTLRATAGAREARSWAPKGIGETEVRIVLGGAMVVSAVLGLWFSRNTTFSQDGIYVFSSTPELDLRGAIEPYSPHLILIPRVVFAAILNAFGAGYLPFRLLTTASVLLTAGLFFEFAKRRIGAVVALAPTLVLLFYGSAGIHVISGGGWGVLLTLEAGLGALMALEREDLRGDIGACLLLCVAVATYSVGFAFVSGAAVLIMLGAARWRRAWVFLIPALLYGAWFLWSRGHGAGAGESPITLSNLLLTPNWMFNSLASVGAALMGLNYPALGEGWGPLVAVVALIALGWRFWRGNITKWLWAAMAVPATLWTLEASAFSMFRAPGSSRYMFTGAIAVLLVAVEAARGVRLGRRGIVILYVVAAISLMTNIALLRDSSAQFRRMAISERADLSAVELGGGRVSPRLTTPVLPAVLLRTGKQNIATGYIEAVRQYGSPAFSLPELRAQAEPIREQVDAALADTFGLRLQPTSAPAGNCQPVTGQGRGFKLPAGGAVLRTTGARGPLRLRRFGNAFTVEAGILAPGVPMALPVPSDAAPDPWYASALTSAVLLCHFKGA
jgi:hypothetical protein